MPSQPLRLYQGETRTYICYKIHTVYKSLYAEQQRKKKKEWKKTNKGVHIQTHARKQQEKKKNTQKKLQDSSLTSKNKRD